MKKFPLGFIWGVIFLMSGCGFVFAGSDETNLPPTLTISLNDGSRVVGTSVENNLRFHSALLGNIKLPLKDIRSIECISSNAAKLTTVSDDYLTVRFAGSRIALQTSFGKVELQTDNLRKLTVSPVGAAGNRGLINIDFGSGGARGFSLKTGPAAVGESDDFWNFYDRDSSPAPNN